MIPVKSIAVAVAAASLVGAVAVITTLRLVPKPDAVTSAQFAAVKAELAAVKDQGARQGVVLSHVVRAGAIAPQVEARPEAEAEAEAEVEAEAEAEAAPDAPNLPGATAEVLATHFDESFAVQTADPDWSRGAEDTVAQVISRRLPDGSSVESVECRQSMCQLRSFHPDMDTYQKFADDALFDRESGLWNGAVTTLVVATSEAGVRSVSYIAREGHEFPPLEAAD